MNPSSPFPPEILAALRELPDPRRVRHPRKYAGCRPSPLARGGGAGRRPPVLHRPGDRLLLFTDGIPEAASPAGEQLGDAGLQQLFAEPSGSSAEAIAGNLIEGVERWTGRSAGFEDDLTLVVVVIP
ncbi:MAG TPA: SpoIIE family protein phosphatase [Thermoanaerobaculia bacterium]|nr:SpoIIE family protein phosphatase [Thermoanaerobaculia bacterium]